MGPLVSRLPTTRLPASKLPSRATSTAETTLARPTAQFWFLGGKGGVGKTTCAAALALSASAHARRTLVISTDPASSLGDALRVRLSGTPRCIAPHVALHAAEINAATALRRWLRPRSPVLEEIALRGTWLDKDDVSALLRLSLPGIDEVAALLELARLGRSGRYDLIVVDTAPTGHTLRMLGMPRVLEGVAGVFDAMQSKYRTMVEALRGRWTPDDADSLIAELDRDGRELEALLQDPARMAVHWVTLAEPMAAEESLDALRAIGSYGIPVARIIVNRVTPVEGRCGWCRARRQLEQQVVARIANRVEPIVRLRCDSPIVSIEERDGEPRGLRVLRSIGRELESAPSTPEGRRQTIRVIRATTPRGRPVPVASFPSEPVRLLLFGGKGGVGKTTCAAAAALSVARQKPSRHVLLLSADPAHSLADAVGVPLSDRWRTLPGAGPNLQVRELDAHAAFYRVRRQYAGAVDAVFDRLSRGSVFDATYDRAVMHGLLDLAPPGIDELVATLDITRTLASTAKTAPPLIVMDTAPTRHALRLLEMPDLVHDWTKALMRILLKYQPVVGLGELGAMLVRLSKELGHVRALLTDQKVTHFVAVTRAAALPRMETARLLDRLGALGIHVAALLVNGVGRGSCDRCRRLTSTERREISTLARGVRRIRRGAEVIVTPGEVPPPHGVDRLVKWRQEWLTLPRY